MSLTSRSIFISLTPTAQRRFGSPLPHLPTTPLRRHCSILDVDIVAIDLIDLLGCLLPLYPPLPVSLLARGTTSEIVRLWPCPVATSAVTVAPAYARGARRLLISCGGKKNS